MLPGSEGCRVVREICFYDDRVDVNELLEGSDWHAHVSKQPYGPLPYAPYGK